MPKDKMKTPKVLILEPYYGGSHKHFLNGLKNHVHADYYQITLPARKWKMRMQLSAPWFSEQLTALSLEKRWFDVVLCSTFVDVAVLRALLARIAGVNPSMKFLTYFHENQFVYPDQFGKYANFQFTAINFNTAIASDKIAFNSKFNHDSFIKNCRSYVKKAADMKFKNTLTDIEKRSQILYPGMEYSSLDNISRSRASVVPVILWNHRWEHDKNPEAFFDALYATKNKGIPFKVMILGQSFQHQPECFQRAKENLKDEIVHFGYVESHKEYCSLVKKCDIVVSTALHEFFGISVLEAVRAGCRPLVPARLSYPELFDTKYLYTDDTFLLKLEACLKGTRVFSKEDSFALTSKYCWTNMKKCYEKWLFE